MEHLIYWRELKDKSIEFIDKDKNSIKIKDTSTRIEWDTDEEHDDSIYLLPHGFAMEYYEVHINGTKLETEHYQSIYRLELNHHKSQEENIFDKCKGVPLLNSIISSYKSHVRSRIIRVLKEKHYAGKVHGHEHFNLEIVTFKREVNYSNDVDRKASCLHNLYDYLHWYDHYNKFETVESMRDFQCAYGMKDIQDFLTCIQYAKDIGEAFNDSRKVDPQDIMEFLENKDNIDKFNMLEEEQEL
jgi:hypothetical protein